MACFRKTALAGAVLVVASAAALPALGQGGQDPRNPDYSSADALSGKCNVSIVVGEDGRAAGRPKVTCQSATAIKAVSNSVDEIRFGESASQLAPNGSRISFLWSFSEPVPVDTLPRVSLGGLGVRKPPPVRDGKDGLCRIYLTTLESTGFGPDYPFAECSHPILEPVAESFAYEMLPAWREMNLPQQNHLELEVRLIFDGAKAEPLPPPRVAKSSRSVPRQGQPAPARPRPAAAAPASQPASLTSRIFAKYESVKPVARYDVLLTSSFDPFLTLEDGFKDRALAEFGKAGFNTVMDNGDSFRAYATARASADIFHKGRSAKIVIQGCDGREFRREVTGSLKGKRGRDRTKAMTKRSEKALKEIRKDKAALRSFLASQPECPTFTLARAFYEDPEVTARFRPADVLAHSRVNDDVLMLLLGRYAILSEYAGTVATNGGRVSIRDYANYRMLRAFHEMRGRLEALDPDWFGKKRAQTRTINRRSGNPKDRYFMSGKTDLGGSLVRGDPDLLEWSIEMGLLDAPTLLTKHQVKRDSPAFALLSSKGESVKIDAALLLNAYDTGNTRVLEQAIAARAPLRFTVAGKSHDLFARALIDGKFDLFSKMARYWDVNRKIPFTDGGHTYLMHYMTPSVRRFDKIFRGQPR
ncbi:MAG: hypothetical protein V2J51_16260, partial [Erythrobacter sp.]|nr:hypothetical protein [Erythrobacter sp.]